MKFLKIFLTVWKNVQKNCMVKNIEKIKKKVMMNA